MPNERAEFIATLDATQLEAALSAARSRVDTMGGGLVSLNEKVEHFSANAEHASGATLKIEEGFEKLHGSTRQISQGIMAMSLVTGEGTGEFAKMFKEVSHLGTAFVLGGPLMGGIIAGVTVVGLLTEAWKADAEESKAWTEYIKNTTTNNVKDLLASIHDLTIELDTFGKNARDKQVAEAEAFVEDTKKYKEFYENDIEARKAQIASRERLLTLGDNISHNREKQLTSEIDQEKKLLEGSEAKLRAQGSDLELGQKKLDQLNQLQLREDLIDAAAERKKAAKADAKDEANDFKGTVDVNDDPDWIKKLQEADKVRAAAEHERLKKQKEDIQAALDDEVDAHNKAQKEMTQVAEKENKKRTEALLHANEEVEKSYDHLFKDVFEGALNTGLSSLQGFLADSIAGHKDAAQKAAAAFLQSEGQQLVGIGTKTIFEGLAISANPLTPGAGAPMVVIGAAAIAAGLGMGAAGAAITPAAAGGTSSAPSRAATDQGVNRGGATGSSSSGSGGVTIYVTYGAAGPAPQDTGRHVVDAIKAYQRSSGITIAPRQQGPSR